ncbi:complement C1r-B subcomponent-like [Amia ocellicauda]|uniref:complement C1r-B subcomponent-like n=1 Tax=Amia ocellicauda TaxID=2972642 RepID=UPI003464C087
MLKHSSLALQEALLKLYNLVLTAGCFPALWNQGLITPIHKSGDKLDPSNYTGICVSSSLGKVICSILNSTILSFLSEHSVLHRGQIGFLPKHRTTDHIYTSKKPSTPSGSCAKEGTESHTSPSGQTAGTRINIITKNIRAQYLERWHTETEQQHKLQYIDECSLEVTEGEEPLCQHLCHNTLGGYLCSCHHGYELQPDKSTCKLQCVGGLFTELGGQLSSPGYPLPSPPGLFCHYNITVDPGFLISLHFTGLFHIEQHHALCPHHWLKVSVPGQEDVSLCGSEAPGMMSTGSYSVQLEYHTDQEGQSRGWTLHYSTERVQCPSPSGITNGRVSPDFPEYRFRDYITIRCDTGYKMMMGKQEIDSYFTVCQSDGQWHLPLPECHIIDCGPPSTLLNGEFLFLSGSQNQYRSLIQYRCNEPFYKLPTKGDGESGSLSSCIDSI